MKKSEVSEVNSHSKARERARTRKYDREHERGIPHPVPLNSPVSWKPEVYVDRQWSSNGLRFATRAEAEASGRELLSRWFVPTDSRAVESTDPVNYRFENGRNVSLTD